MIPRFITLLFSRSYKVLTLSFLSLFIGSFFFGVVFSFSKSAHDYLLKEGKVLAGGDIIISSPYPISLEDEIFKKLRSLGHVVDTGKQLQAVFSREDTAQAATIRAVSNLYPLYGEVVIENGEFTYAPFGLYAEKSFLERINAKAGDKVMLASSTFTILGVLMKEPDQVAAGISFTPKVLLFEQDIQGSPFLAESRTQYKVYIKEGSTPLTKEEINSLREYARVQKWRFDDASDGPNNVIRGISSVSDFIGIVLTVTLFLVMVNVLANLVYVLSRFRKTIALMKVYGATHFQITSIFSCILAIVGGLAGGFGALLGGYSSLWGGGYISSYFQINVHVISPWYVGGVGALFGITFLLITAIPFLRSLKNIHPRELLVSPAFSFSSSTSEILGKIASYSLILSFLIVLLYGITKDTMLSLISILGALLIFVFFMTGTHFFLKALHKIRAQFSLIGRSIISFLYLRNLETIVTTASIMTAFVGIFLISSLERNIAINLSQNVSKSAPSLYLVDISKSQLPYVEEVVGESFVSYPIVRGRLLSIQNKDLTQSDQPNIRREFNMTYRTSLIEGEKVIEGEFNKLSGDKPVVSIDKEFGEELGGVELGDVITVFIQGITIEAIVTSIREVDSRSGIPFFYLVFPPEVLQSFPSTYFGTAYVDQSTRKIIEQKLAGVYPNIIPIDTTSVITTVASLLEQVNALVIIVGIPSILLGLILVLVMLYQSLYERSGDVLVLRAFGLEKKRILSLFVIESGGIVLFSGLFAYLLATGISYGVTYYLFSFTTFVMTLLPLHITLIVFIIICVFSFVLANVISGLPLKKLLAENK